MYELSTREGQVVAGLCLLAGLAGVEIEQRDNHLVWAALAGLLTVTMLARSAYKIPGVRLDVTCPPRVAVGEEVSFTLAVTNEGPEAVYALRVAGPFLPWDGVWIRGAPTIPAVRPGETVRVTSRARFSARGEHHLDAFRVAALVPLGLTQGPSVYSSGTRFVVVPPVANVQAIQTPRTSRHQPGGVPRAGIAGDSMDLRGVRPYRPGDPRRDLHARSWARAGAPVVREWQQEFFRRVAVVLDADARALVDSAALDAAVSVAAGVVSLLAREDTLVDLVLVGAQLHELNARGGRGSEVLGMTLDLLACVEPGAPLDAARVMRALGPHLRGLSSVVVITAAPGDAHATLAMQLAGIGVGVRVLAVTDDPTAPGVVAVSRAAVERGEAVLA